MKKDNESDEIFNILEKIASEFKKDSKEYLAIKKAASGLHYIKQLEVENKFQEYSKTMDKPLNKAQIKHLRSMGIDPKELK